VFCFYIKAQSLTDQTGVPHCSELISSLDGKTSACKVWDNDEQKFSNPTQIEIYRHGQLAFRIETDAPIREWHFWEGANQLSVHVGKSHDPGAYELFDLTTGKRIGKLDSVSSASALPQWAKTRAQLDDESVPEGPVYSEQRILWLGKVIRQVAAISPGMT